MLEIAIVLVIIGLLLGGVMLVMGRLMPRRGDIRSFGLLSACWALLMARLWWHDIPLAYPWPEIVEVALLALATLAAVQFAMRRGARRSWSVSAGLVLQCVLAPAVMVAAGCVGSQVRFGCRPAATATTIVSPTAREMPRI